MSILLNGAAAAADIRDIHGPMHVPEPTPWLTYALLVLAAPLLFWSVRWIRRELRARVKPLSPYQLAQASLAAADASIDNQAPDAFAEQVSGAVRRYIEARFALPVTHRTSEEFLTDLLTRADVSPLLAAKRPELGHFLEICDLAKFAARSLRRETMRALISSARSFIDAAERPTGATS
ncbi:MAG TPA: DUF4381 family protein [Polyangiales bacterium]|jgi:hypothetical protein|nr:DUF4381 family protein [Polyangiales bacterium]